MGRLRIRGRKIEDIDVARKYDIVSDCTNIGVTGIKFQKKCLVCKNVFTTLTNKQVMCDACRKKFKRI